MSQRGPGRATLLEPSTASPTGAASAFYVPSTGPLTDAEAEILRLLDAGRNAPQIAAVLSRSPHTVRTHIRNASAKLDAHGRVDLLARARQLGIVSDTG